MKNPIINIILFLILTSCINTNDKNLNGKPENKSVEKTEKSVKNNENLKTQFKLFLNHFNNDSIFQISRIIFPLKIFESDYENEYELKERVIEKEEFRKINLSYEKSFETRKYDKYKQTIRLEGNKAIIEIRGIDNGIYSDYIFEKIDGKWKLKTWTNSST